MSEKPPVIEHDETEFADKSAHWGSTWAILIILVGGNLYLFGLDWRSGLMGFVVGLTLAAWAIDVTGGKVPKSWRNSASRSSR